MRKEYFLIHFRGQYYPDTKTRQRKHIQKYYRQIYLMNTDVILKNISKSNTTIQLKGHVPPSSGIYSGEASMV